MGQQGKTSALNNLDNKASNVSNQLATMVGLFLYVTLTLTRFIWLDHLVWGWVCGGGVLWGFFLGGGWFVRKLHQRASQ